MTIRYTTSNLQGILLYNNMKTHKVYLVDHVFARLVHRRMLYAPFHMLSIVDLWVLRKNVQVSGEVETITSRALVGCMYSSRTQQCPMSNSPCMSYIERLGG